MFKKPHYFRRSIFAFVLMLSVQAAAVETPKQALPVTLTFEPEVNPKLASLVSDMVDSAVTLVSMFTPKEFENNLFNWTADRKILRNKSLSIVLATSSSPTLWPLMRHSGAVNLDAFTLAPINIDQQSLKIFVVLLVDKIFFDPAGRERPDGFSKLTVALAHEVLGNVQHFLEMDIANAKPQTQGDRARQERKAFRASILFLGEIADDPKAATLPANVRQGLLDALPFERAAYDSWLKAHPSEEPDPACEAMLKHLRMRAD